MSARQPTLLVFSLGPAAEARRKRLLPARWRGVEARLWQGCLAAAISAGRESGCRVLVSSPEPLELDGDVARLGQRGESFGQRLGASLAQLDPAAPWVLVGADSPDLSAAVIRRALASLDGNPRRVVIGPSPDGGIYLLAARAPLAELLAGTRWRYRSTREDLRRRLEAAGFEIQWLSPLADLDARRDLERWLAAASAGAVAGCRALVGLLRALLAELRHPLPVLNAPSPRLATVATLRGRAPPPRA